MTMNNGELPKILKDKIMSADKEEPVDEYVFEVNVVEAFEQSLSEFDEAYEGLAD
jgi:hypothetical protein